MTTKIRMGNTVTTWTRYGCVCGIRRAIVKGKYANARLAREACERGETYALLVYWNGRKEFRKGQVGLQKS